VIKVEEEVVEAVVAVDEALHEAEVEFVEVE
jgi:hypothetical protein